MVERRIGLLFAAFFLCLTVVLARALWLQGVRGGALASQAINQQTDVVVDALQFDTTHVTVEAYEEDATNASWDVVAIARCARAP